MFFMKPTAQVLRAQDLKDAERDLGEHLKATEYHGARADMYAARVARLKAEMATDKQAVDVWRREDAATGGSV